MNGLEALQAMKEGKTVRYVRDWKGRHSLRDSLYCYRTKYNPDTVEHSKRIWHRFAGEWIWTPSENPPEFWMITDGFEIAEGVE